MKNRNPKVDAYFIRIKQWQKESLKLRMIIQSRDLNEELRWGKPCYTFHGTNVVLIHGFKEYCALLFMKGALIKDAYGILIQQTKNVQAARQIRFTDLRQITKMQPILKTYIEEAIQIEKAGLKVELKKTSEFEMPEEFEIQLNKNPKLRKAFHALTPGRQRGYLLHFSAAKQSKTRQSRVEKFIPQILAGKGLDD